MDIALYISELLRDHNEVGLPGIGTFYKKRISAGFNREWGLYTPPVEEIAFRSNDSGSPVLVEYISAVKKISKPSARYFINKFSESIKNSLSAEGRADLSPIGILQYSESGVYMLPSVSTPAHFGLPQLKESFWQPGQRIPEVSAEEPDGPAVMEPKEEEANESRGKTWRTVFIATGAFVAVMASIYVFYPDLFNLKTDRPMPVQKTRVPVVARQPLVPDTVKNKDTSRVVVKKAVPSADTTARATPTIRYEVIGASLALKTEAEAYLRLMHSKGIKAKIFEDTRKPKFKISLGSYTSYEEANQEKRRIQGSFNKEAWIYTVKDKDKQ